ncbi:helix-turn-helix transcriptional regulator [Neorhizobium sp. T6_25]|uniref:helix-turn-helix domain-containing protein n=1 Tax=Neorhizobium sp. T6_25 TaxID=2093833 RepID=UPI000CF99675|nr:helix-turn-helix transcriptional regulator [Neorhizobium sp. T6_25]
MDLKIMRNQIGVTQVAMAEAMGMPLRSYEDVESGKSATRPIHIAAAKWAAIKIKATGKSDNPLPSDVAEMARHALEQDAGDISV